MVHVVLHQLAPPLLVAVVSVHRPRQRIVHGATVHAVESEAIAACSNIHMSTTGEAGSSAWHLLFATGAMRTFFDILDCVCQAACPPHHRNGSVPHAHQLCQACMRKASACEQACKHEG